MARHGRPVQAEQLDVAAAYSAHGAEQYRFALRQLGDGSAAQDVVQEVFLRAWRASESYDPQLASLVAGLTPLAARLAGVDPDRLDETPAPPPELRDAVLARIAAEPRPPVELAVHRRRRVVAAATAVAIAAAAFAVGWLVRPEPSPGPSRRWRWRRPTPTSRRARPSSRTRGGWR